MKTVFCSQCGCEFPSDKNYGFSHCEDHQIQSQEYMVTVAFDAMRVCMGMMPLHHDAEALGRFITSRAYFNIAETELKK